MKKLLVLLVLACVCFSGCSQNEPEEIVAATPTPVVTKSNKRREGFFEVKKSPEFNEDIAFTLEQYPRIDGSTANIPLGQLLAKKFLRMSDDDVQEFVDFSGTSVAYEKLKNKETDLLLVYEASEKTVKELTKKQKNPAEFELYPIGLDSLVFIVNESNPVKSLSVDEIKKIYTGKIKNWKELGGENLDIAAFQRNETSGSQTLMDKLIMKDQPMMKAPAESIVAEMGDLIETLAEYSNKKNSIGYSVFYYANFMYAKEGLKFLNIDGIKPSNKSIKSGKYNLTNSFFAVVRADEPEDSPARKLAYWLTGNEGQDLVEKAGYVGVGK